MRKTSLDGHLLADLAQRFVPRESLSHELNKIARQVAEIADVSCLNFPSPRNVRLKYTEVYVTPLRVFLTSAKCTLRGSNLLVQDL